MKFEYRLETKNIELLDLKSLAPEGAMDVAITNKTVTIRWELHLEFRQYGVKDISALVTSDCIELDLDYSIGDDVKSCTVRVPLNNVEVRIVSLGSIYPSTLEQRKDKWILGF